MEIVIGILSGFVCILGYLIFVLNAENNRIYLQNRDLKEALAKSLNLEQQLLDDCFDNASIVASEYIQSKNVSEFFNNEIVLSSSKIRKATMPENVKELRPAVVRLVNICRMLDLYLEEYNAKSPKQLDNNLN